MSAARPRAARLLAALAITLALVARAAVADQGAGGPVDPALLARIRERFYVAVDDQEATYALGAYIESLFPGVPQDYPPVVLAYYAAVEGLKGRHDGNLLKKYHYVKGAIGLFEPLVQGHPENLEVRFLRFSFYHQIPAVFGVRARVPEDLEATLRLLEHKAQAEVPRSVQRDMVDYLLRSGEASREQRERLAVLSRELQRP